MVAQIFKHIILAGTFPSQDIRQSLRIRTMNVIYLWVGLFSLLFAILGVFIRPSFFGISISVTSAAFGFAVPWLNGRGETTKATIIHLFLSGIPALYFSIEFGFSTGFYLYTMVAPMSMMLFIDTNNSRQMVFTSLYYFGIFIIDIVAYEYGYDGKLPYPLLFLAINFIFTGIINMVLALNFTNTNNKYYAQIAEKNQILETQKSEIEEKNRVLQQNNAKIQLLVRELNDKVKNNLQAIIVFAELDRMSAPTTDIETFTRLQKSRIQVMDICYKMVFEKEVAEAQSFHFFFAEYYPFLKKLYPKKISRESSYTLHLADNCSLRHKQFDALTLLINELHFQVIDALPAPMPLQVTINFEPLLQPVDKVKYLLSIRFEGYPMDFSNFNQNSKIFAASIHVKIETVYIAAQSVYTLNLSV